MPLFKSKNRFQGSVISNPLPRSSYEEADYYARLAPQSAPPRSYLVKPEWRGPRLRPPEDELEELEENSYHTARDYGSGYGSSARGPSRRREYEGGSSNVGSSRFEERYESRRAMRSPAPFRDHRPPPSESRSAPDKLQKHQALKAAKSTTNLSLKSSDLGASKGKHARKASLPDTPDDGSERAFLNLTLHSDLRERAGWVTRSGEALAKVRLTTVVKSLQESKESLFVAITQFTLDLSEPDPKYDVSKYLQLAGQALVHLPNLSSLRIVGPRDSRIVLPEPICTALAKSGANLDSLALSRISSIEDPSTFARSLGHTCLSLKLNDCKAAVWRPLLKYCVHLESLEALVPPEGLSWLSRKQWASLRSLRLGYGSIEALNDLLESATAVDEEPVYETALDTLVVSHFAPLPLDVIVRLSRTLGTPEVRKLELSRISAAVFEPRLLVNLAAYFENVEDLRIHSADDAEEDLNLQEGRKARTRPVDWCRGRYGMDDYGLALASFNKLKTLEINHCREPELVIDQPSRQTTEADRDLVSSDGRPLKELLLIDARNLAAKVRTVRRIGYSFCVAGAYLDVAITFERDGKRSILPFVKAHWSVPKDKGQ